VVRPAIPGIAILVTVLAVSLVGQGSTTRSIEAEEPMSDSILSLEHLGVRLPKAPTAATRSRMSLAIKPDEILCVVGESGSGSR